MGKLFDQFIGARGFSLIRIAKWLGESSGMLELEDEVVMVRDRGWGWADALDRGPGALKGLSREGGR